MPNIRIHQCSTTPRKCELIIGNGSERGDYIDSLQIQKDLGWVHDGIQIMNTYYPNDPHWDRDRKISEARPKSDITYAWDHEYDDYHPFDLGRDGSLTEKKLADIVAVGSNAHLTITMDPSLPDEAILKALRKLRNYGRVFLRINHEANGEWFRHNKKHSYKEVSDFFVRCHRLVKKFLPNVETVFSLSADVFVGDQVNSKVTSAKARLEKGSLCEALQIADYWSIDKYVTLNWGWPYHHPSSSDKYFKGTLDTWWRLIEECYLLMIWANNGSAKPLYLHEFNTDADVVGRPEQAQTIAAVYERIAASDLPWLKGICFYQYCDAGGLGLYQGDARARMATPSLEVYRALSESFPIATTITGDIADTTTRFDWRSPGNASGVSIESDRPLGRLKNTLGRPIYAVFGNRWNLVAENEEIDITANKMNIFGPPVPEPLGTSSNFLLSNAHTKLLQLFNEGAY